MKEFVLKENMGRARFSAAPWFSKLKDKAVTVVGAGGIGTWLVTYLVKAGVRVLLYDMDDYNINNLGGQLIPHKYINVNKAQALADFSNELVGLHENGEPHVIAMGEFTESSVVTEVTLAAVDSMKVRETIYEVWKEQDHAEIFIDGRMGAEQCQVITTLYNDLEYYTDHWFPDNEAATLPCAYKATAFVGSLTASIMMQQLVNYLSNNTIAQKVTYTGPMMDFQADNYIELEEYSYG